MEVHHKITENVVWSVNPGLRTKAASSSITCRSKEDKLCSYHIQIGLNWGQIPNIAPQLHRLAAPWSDGWRCRCNHGAVVHRDRQVYRHQRSIVINALSTSFHRIIASSTWKLNLSRTHPSSSRHRYKFIAPVPSRHGSFMLPFKKAMERYLNLAPSSHHTIIWMVHTSRCGIC